MDIKIAKREDDLILNWMNKKTPYNGCVFVLYWPRIVVENNIKIKQLLVELCFVASY